MTGSLQGKFPCSDLDLSTLGYKPFCWWLVAYSTVYSVSNLSPHRYPSLERGESARTLVLFFCNLRIYMAKKKTVFAKTDKNGHKYSRRPHRKEETLIVRQSKVSCPGKLPLRCLDLVIGGARWVTGFFSFQIWFVPWNVLVRRPGLSSYVTTFLQVFRAIRCTVPWPAFVGVGGLCNDVFIFMKITIWTLISSHGSFFAFFKKCFTIPLHSIEKYLQLIDDKK